MLGGCTYDFALNYNPTASFDDGSCIERVEGCTDLGAVNYNINANSDDGSCIQPLAGCTDCSADNYNPAATSDDGSCIAAPNECPGDFTGDGFVNVSDLGGFLGAFGSECE